MIILIIIFAVCLLFKLTFLPSFLIALAGTFWFEIENDKRIYEIYKENKLLDNINE